MEFEIEVILLVTLGGEAVCVLAAVTLFQK